MNVGKEEEEEEEEDDDDVMTLDSVNSRNIRSFEIPGSSGTC
jgi:hypothetical protein